MIDGPASFVIAFAFLGAALLGAVGFLACVVGTCHRRYRPHVRRSWKFGAVGGVIAVVATSLLLFVALGGTERSLSVFAQWGGTALFAGFGAGVTLNAVLRGLGGRDVGQTPPDGRSKPA